MCQDAENLLTACLKARNWFEATDTLVAYYKHFHNVHPNEQPTAVLWLTAREWKLVCKDSKAEYTKKNLKNKDRDPGRLREFRNELNGPVEYDMTFGEYQAWYGPWHQAYHKYDPGMHTVVKEGFAAAIMDGLGTHCINMAGLIDEHVKKVSAEFIAKRKG